MDTKAEDIKFYNIFLRKGKESNSFDIMNGKGSLVETIGVFPGAPELCDPGFAYVARKLEIFDGGARCKAVVGAGTFDEAEWVAYGLAKKVAERMNGNNLYGIMDTTGRRKVDNPYAEEVENAYRRIGLLE